MTDSRHLLLSVPSEWSTDDKGDFYEEFVLELLRPMRLRAERRLRVTGMELDILAKGEDRPLTVLVECKAHRDPIAADVITKLLGNVQLRHADQGWLFSTSDLTKDGRGLWEEIQNDPVHSRVFFWYSPSRIVDVLIAQRAIVDPSILLHFFADSEVGDWSLIVTPGKQSWLVELPKNGLPVEYSVFDARDGSPLNALSAAAVATASSRYAGLAQRSVTLERPVSPTPTVHASVARVISGDAWDDPRPARPVDFVGRDEVLGSIARFIEDVRTGATATRSFAVLAPSGWGKSSLALKLSQLAAPATSSSYSVTAVDSRSATSPAFVAEALRMALRDATSGIASQRQATFRIQSLREPLDSPDIETAIKALRDHGRVSVLVFDQFEELFAKESLFEVFHAVRDLTLDVDARQIPVVLGFAWKTDVSLPQEHPAYHLWHQLGDRRKTFKVGEFGTSEIARVVSKAERALGKPLSRPLRSRLAEQCQGLPWLLKKLLVHVLQRVSTVESQYLLLERELDIELLFKEDLEQLQDEHVRCLKFVAARAPISVAEVEEAFARDTTNLLINQHLLVRSGMNYVVYWDIFRDYLVEGKVPAIPWARTFQRTPPVALKAVTVLGAHGPLSAAALGEKLALKEGPTFNVLGDLVALQLVESDSHSEYRVARHVTDLGAVTLASIVRNQLRRHVIARAIERTWPKGQVVDNEAWLAFFRAEQSRSAGFSPPTLRQYANNLKGWLVFSGLLEVSTRGLVRADGAGAQMGVVASIKSVGGLFLGTAGPRRLELLLKKVLESTAPVTRAECDGIGLRNAVSDALALGLVDVNGGRIVLHRPAPSLGVLVDEGRASVRRQPAIRLALECLTESGGDRTRAADRLAKALAVAWKRTSARRYLGGLLSYAEWARLSRNA